MKITNPQDAGQVNKELGYQIEALRKELNTLRHHFKELHHRVNNIDAQHAPLTTNNLVFTWTGSTSTLSWPAGFIRHKNSLNVPVPAGSITGLSANTFYWMTWSISQQKMLAQISAPLQNANNIVLCQVFTGTTGQSGTAGGGGIVGGSDLSGSRYKQF